MRQEFFCGCCRASVAAPVELFQHGGVGLLKNPLLRGGGGVARVHEDSPLVGAAVDTTVTDRVIQTLILEEGWRNTKDCLNNKIRIYFIVTFSP